MIPDGAGWCVAMVRARMLGGGEPPLGSVRLWDVTWTTLNHAMRGLALRPRRHA